MKQGAVGAKKDRDQHRRLPIRQNRPQPFVRMTSVGAAQVAEKIGDPGRIRTSDLQLRRLLLYPTELRGLGPQCRTNIARAAMARGRQRVGPTDAGRGFRALRGWDGIAIVVAVDADWFRS